jgi:hypothetical protein
MTKLSEEVEKAVVETACEISEVFTGASCVNEMYNDRTEQILHTLAETVAREARRDSEKGCFCACPQCDHEPCTNSLCMDGGLLATREGE